MDLCGEKWRISSPVSLLTISIKIMFIGEYKYPDWFTHKTYSFYKKKLDHLARLRYIHTESAAYYDKQHFKLYAPSIIITGLSGVASFLASSSLFNDTSTTVYVSLQ